MKASKKTKDTRMVYATLYLTFDLHKGLKKYCRLNGFTIPTFIEKLILSWYQQNCKIDPDFIENQEHDVLKHIDFVSEELENKVKNEKYKEL